MEGDAPALYQPSKAAWKVPGQGDHKAGRWVGVERAADSTAGSKCQGDDWVSSGVYAYANPHPGPPSLSPVTMTWSVPWLWRLLGTSGSGQQFTSVDHVAYDYGNGTARLTKGGVDVSAMAADPAQWFYSLDDTVTQIQGYYSSHPQGYGTPWPAVEARLRCPYRNELPHEGQTAVALRLAADPHPERPGASAPIDEYLFVLGSGVKDVLPRGSAVPAWHRTAVSVAGGRPCRRLGR